MVKLTLVMSLFIMSVSAFALDKKERAEADSEIKQSCSSEVSTANCSDKSYGKGLMKCLENYKKQHKEFQISEGCKSARKKIAAENKSFRSMKKSADVGAEKSMPQTTQQPVAQPTQTMQQPAATQATAPAATPAPPANK